MSRLSNWLRDRIYGPRPPANKRGASEELIEEARALRGKLEKYQQAPDPLAALMTDLFNQREMKQ